MASDTKTKTGSVILMSAGQENDVTVVRLDRASESKIGESPECHVTEGPFKGIVVKQTVDEKGRLPPVGNPNVRTWFFAHTRDKNTDLENATYSRERREICFWFRRKASKSDQISQTTKYFKSLIEPEHFPKDYVSFIKKSMLLMQEFPLMRRVQLSVRPEPDTEGDYDGFSLRPEAEDEEPPIGRLRLHIYSQKRIKLTPRRIRVLLRDAQNIRRRRE